MLENGIRIRNTDLNTRLVMAPVALEKSDSGKVSQNLLDYYDERTKGGHVGLVVIEHSFVRTDGRVSANQLSVSDDSDIAGLAKLANVIHSNGSKALMQISHAGAAAKEGIVTEDAISPSGISSPNGALGKGTLKKTHAMSLSEIDSIKKAFVDAALRVQAAGFDGVELHSAHAYLLNQFYSPLTNKRTDEYSGDSIQGRIRLHIELIQAVRNAVKDDFIVAMRLGGCDYMEGGSTIDDAVEAVPLLIDAGLDLMDISGGLCFFDREGHSEAGYFGDLSSAVKKVSSVPVIVAGGIKSREDAEHVLSSGMADLAGVARAVVADPSFPAKLFG